MAPVETRGLLFCAMEVSDHQNFHFQQDSTHDPSIIQDFSGMEVDESRVESSHLPELIASVL